MLFSWSLGEGRFQVSVSDTNEAAKAEMIGHSVNMQYNVDIYFRFISKYPRYTATYLHDILQKYENENIWAFKKR